MSVEFVNKLKAELSTRECILSDFKCITEWLDEFIVAEYIGPSPLDLFWKHYAKTVGQS